MSVNVLVGRLESLWDVLILHDLDLLLKDTLSDEHLVVHLEPGEHLGGGCSSQAEVACHDAGGWLGECLTNSGLDCVALCHSVLGESCEHIDFKYAD
jgi:hypothetical protein